MPASYVVKNQNDVTVTFQNAAGTVSIALQTHAGDLAIQGAFQRRLQAVNPYQTRGVLHSLRHTERTFPTISGTGHFLSWSGNEKAQTDGSVFEAVMRDGSVFGAVTSTTSTTGDVYTLDVVITVEGTDFGDSADHTVTLHDVHLMIDWSSGDPSTYSFSGTVYGEVSGDVEAALAA